MMYDEDVDPIDFFIGPTPCWTAVKITGYLVLNLVGCYYLFQMLAQAMEVAS